MNLIEEELTEIIIGEAIDIHKKLGPGLLESVYERILANRLIKRGIEAKRQEKVSFEFEDQYFIEGLRVDLLVENRIIVEIKSTEHLHPVHKKQLLTYLRLKNLQVGLLINFGQSTLKNGLERIINGYQGEKMETLPLTEQIITSFAQRPRGH
jgi:iron complex transport system substrate-binding protein